MSVLTARALTVEERGIYAAAMIIAVLSAGLAQFGLGPAFVLLYRATPQARATTFLLKAALLVSLASGMTAAAVTLFNPEVSSKYFFEILWLATGAGVLLLINAMSQIEKDLIAYNLIRLSLPSLMLLFAVIVWWCASLNVHAILLAQGVLTCIVATLGMLWLIGRTKREVGRGEGEPPLRIQQATKLGWKYHSIAVLGLITTNADKVFLYIGGTLSEFGLYSIAVASSRLLGSVQESISSAIFSAHAGEGSKGLTSATLLAFRLSFYPLLALASVLSLNAEALVGAVFGVEYEKAALSFSILCFDSIVAGGAWVLAQHFTAAGRPGPVLLRQLFSLAPLCILLPFLPKTDTIAWLSLALLAASSTRLLISIAMLKRDAGTRFREFLPNSQDFHSAYRQYLKVVRVN